MCRGASFLACSCGDRDGVDADVLLQQVQVGSRQQGQLDGCGEAARVSDVLRLHNRFLVNLRQTVDIVVVALDAEVLCQIDNLDLCGDGMFLQERLTLAVAEAEEHYVDIIKRHLIGEQ